MKTQDGQFDRSAAVAFQMEIKAEPAFIAFACAPYEAGMGSSLFLDLGDDATDILVVNEADNG